jgi:hypothetical protein
MARRADVIGVDFGTTNTYLTLCPYGTKNKTPLQFSGTSAAIDTAILYADTPAESSQDMFPLIGEMATKTYGIATEEEKKEYGYRYYCNFKPEIVSNELARRCAVDFFEALKREAQRTGFTLGQPANEAIIGAPCEASPEFRTTLQGLMVKAGLGQPEVVDEPKGVLLSDLGINRFPLADIIDGYLVIDFGGGTCDFAFLRRGEVVSGYGNMSLGGRLFDDLFYQWFLEQNPGIEEKIIAERREYYVWSYLCRVLKEDFSETIARDPNHVFKAEVGKYGIIDKLTKQGFQERAKNYTPSQAFRNFEKLMGLELSLEIKQGGVDLISLFRRSLLSGIKEHEEVKAVSLSGGSSKWYFVRELCTEIFHLSPERILATPNPFGAISEGLSILPAVKEELETVKSNLTRDRENFIEQILLPHIKSSLDICANKLAAKVASELFDQQFVPFIQQSPEEKFTIAKVEEGIKKIAIDYEPHLAQLISEEINAQIGGLSIILEGKIQAWLSTSGLRLAGRLPGATLPHLQELQVDQPVGDRLSEPLLLVVKTTTYTLTSLLVASLCGGGGIALVSTGIYGLIFGFLGGIWISYLGLKAGRGGITSGIKKLRLPKMLSKRLITEKNILKARNQFLTDLTVKMEESYQVVIGELQKNLHQAITREIEQIGMINLNISWY